MIRNFVGGVITGAVCKMIIAFLFFHFLYMVVLIENHVIRILLRVRKHMEMEMFIVDFMLSIVRGKMGRKGKIDVARAAIFLAEAERIKELLNLLNVEMC